MSLDQVLERTTIRFPVSIGTEEAEKLLEHVSAKLSCRIEYHLSENRRIIYDGQLKKSSRSSGSSKISGSIYNGARSASFESFGFFASAPAHQGIRFFTPPGYELGEISKEEIGLMDSVRKQMEAFFSKRK